MVGKVTAAGDVRYLAQFPYISMSGMAVDAQGTLYAAAGGMGAIYRLVERTGEASVFELVAGLPQPFPNGGFVDGDGATARMKLPGRLVYDGQDFYFIDAGNLAVRKMAPDGRVTSVAGGPTNTASVDGTGAAAGFSALHGLVRLAGGDFLVLDGDRWRRMTPQGQVTTLPGTVPEYARRATVAAGADAVYALREASVVRLGLDGSVRTVAGVWDAAGYDENPGTGARFNTLTGLAVLANGDLVLADTGNAVIRRITAGEGAHVAVIGRAPRNGRADGTGAAARFDQLNGSMALDAAGNLYLLDVQRENVRKVTPQGIVSTLFSGFPSQGGLAIDAAGNLYGVRNRAIVRVAPDGSQSIFAGQPGVLGFADGPALEATFARPQGLAFDLQGNLFVGDAPDITSTGWFAHTSSYKYGNTIRKITPAGVVSTFSGARGREFIFGAGTPGDLSADYHAPSVLAVDATGRVHVLDTRLGNVRRIGPEGGAPTLLAPVAGAGTTGALTAMAVRPNGEVFFTLTNSDGVTGFSRVTLFKLDAAGGAPRLVAGQAQAFRHGVRLGALPGALNFVQGLMASGDVIYALSENSVLTLREG
ncbi:hypothetical protein FN976_27530 [Caenimonas sedimenti]|uniref:Gluconolaconase n=2 Tax=Caenimonas sedimenti TaxID=2596921 RepID=A0A562ZEZ2_9BURK|nr:hypothetical protein FN976_27530 [Caenimonas sedimenti]